MAENNVLSGVIAIILGLLIIAFPVFSVFTLTIITGLGLIFIGIWLFIIGFESWKSNKVLSLAALILGLIGIVVGIGLFGKLLAFSILVGLAIYIVGLFLIITGILAFVSGKGASGRWGGILGILLGIIYLVLGIFALNPLYLAILIGIFLIITGIFQIFMPAAEE